MALEQSSTLVDTYAHPKVHVPDGTLFQVSQLESPPQGDLFIAYEGGTPPVTTPPLYAAGMRLAACPSWVAEFTGDVIVEVTKYDVQPGAWHAGVLAVLLAAVETFPAARAEPGNIIVVTEDNEIDDFLLRNRFGVPGLADEPGKGRLVTGMPLPGFVAYQVGARGHGPLTRKGGESFRTYPPPKRS